MSDIVQGNLGPVTAYAYAKAGGYTGTEADFQALMAANVDAAQYADEVRAAAAAANEDKEAAAESKDAAAASQADAATSKAAAEVAANYARAFTGAPRVAATAAAMTDQSLIYVYTGSETGYTAGNWYFWDGTAWASGGVYNSTALETDETLTISGRPADAKATGNAVDDLKSATDDEFVVTRRKMIYYRGENLFDKNNLSDGFMTAAGVVGGSGESYKHTTKIPVIAGETISFWRINQTDYQSTGIVARFLCAFNSDDTAVEASGGTYVNTTYTVPSGIVAVVLTFDVAYLAYDVVVKTGAEPPVSYTAYHTPYYMASTDFITPHYQNNPGCWSKSIATLSAITYLPKTNIVKNVIYTFSTKVSNFDSILIGQGYLNKKYETFMTLDTTHATFTLKESGDAREYSYEHGLTIDEFLNITISVKSNAQADVFVQTKGGTYTRTIGWYGYSRGQYCLLPGANGIFTDAVFTVSCRDLVHAKTFLFGDSYAANLPDVNRWTHWLVDAGFGDNVMINACPGINTSDTMYPLYDALDVGKPKYLVWALGMNDGADTGDTPNAAWKTGVDAVISLCEKYDIEPIFCTIPTVPSINHEAKNAWVRSSGYRYIDFARAVGATSSGAWFTGMLSNDNVHPAEPGAKAQWQRVLCDFPEITT